MRRAWLAGVVLFAASILTHAHDMGSTPVTWNREISRLVFDRCASCHRPGGTSFSLMTYADAQPRGVAIRDAVLSRRMPPWGAVKGFGNFRNDQALSQEQIELVVRWVTADMRRGNRNAVPKEPAITAPAPVVVPLDAIRVSGPATLAGSIALDGLFAERVTPDQSLRIVAVLPDGRTRPLVWLHGYDERMPHVFLLREVLHLPAGTVIRGIPPEVAVSLIPAHVKAS
jgi:mono/diheme cytochrome c family protein